MRIEIPEFSLVALIGGTSSGKTTFASRHFRQTEVLSSDFFRGLIADDENDQSASSEAFDALFYIADKRLSAMRLTVIDATNVQASARRQILDLAREQNCHAVALVFDMPEKICKQRNAERADRQLPEHVIRRHCADLRRSIKRLKKEGFRYVYVFHSPEEAAEAEIVRMPMWNDRRSEHGPFDIIGDVHGCADELRELLEKLGYQPNGEGVYRHPEGRKALFLGDLCDRGPKNMEVLRLVMAMVGEEHALCVPGNHDVKLLRWLNGRNVQMTHGLQNTVEEMEREDEAFRGEAAAFLDSLISHCVLDDGRLVAAHAGLKEKLQGRGSKAVRDFCLYGEVSGETDEYGLPVRVNWAAEYRGKAAVVYGHIPQLEPQVMNNTYCLDTGCVFGGKLTALQYPERTFVEVEAKQCYYEPVKPLQTAAEDRTDDMLSAEDVSGRMNITTALERNILVREENSAAALEVMSRFAADPHWLIYLPPTMSPCETSPLDEYLEHPAEAFRYFEARGVKQVVCEKKHMGSRAVIVLARNREAAEQRFGTRDGRQGIIYTRTGRHFFNDAAPEEAILSRLCGVLTKTGFWDEFKTDWVCLDTELLPWSAKAQALLEKQYAPVGRAGKTALGAAVKALEDACRRGNTSYEVSEITSGQNVNLDSVLEDFRQRKSAVEGYTDAYRRYCWNVESVDDYRVAPFHILAAEGKTYSDKDHVWHMESIRRYCIADDPLFLATEYLCVDVTDPDSQAAGIRWWEELTGNGGEGMVVKPFHFIARGEKGLLQPAVKCRGREYLRIIYGPEYTRPEHMQRLKKRSLSRKRQLALKEFALGMESLERFVGKEPLYRVHECVFGVLAFESEPVDPRL